MIPIDPDELQRRLAQVDNDMSLGRHDKAMVKALALRYRREGFQPLMHEAGLYSNAETAAALKTSLGTVSKLSRGLVNFPSSHVLLRLGRRMAAVAVDAKMEAEKIA